MKQDDAFKELEKKAYLNYHEDGVLDLIMGMCCLGVATFFATGSIVFNMFSWMPVLFFKPLKNRITFPRIGYVNFATRRGRPARIMLLLTVTVVLGLLVLGTAFYVNTGRLDPAVRAWLGEHLILILGLLFAAIVAVAAFSTSIRRLYVYAGLTVVSFVVSFLLHLPEFAGFLAVGTVVFVSGIVQVVRFVRKYPIPKEE
jgi:hypothetical protein